MVNTHSCTLRTQSDEARVVSMRSSQTPANPESTAALKAAKVPRARLDKLSESRPPPPARKLRIRACSSGDYVCTRTTPAARAKKVTQSIGRKRRPRRITEKMAAEMIFTCSTACTAKAERCVVATKSWLFWTV